MKIAGSGSILCRVLPVYQSIYVCPLLELYRCSHSPGHPQAIQEVDFTTMRALTISGGLYPIERREIAIKSVEVSMAQGRARAN